MQIILLSEHRYVVYCIMLFNTQYGTICVYDMSVNGEPHIMITFEILFPIEIEIVATLVCMSTLCDGY